MKNVFFWRRSSYAVDLTKYEELKGPVIPRHGIDKKAEGICVILSVHETQPESAILSANEESACAVAFALLSFSHFVLVFCEGIKRIYSA